MLSALSAFSQTTVQATPAGTYSYIMSISGSNYQITSGTTNQVIYQSTSSSQAFNTMVSKSSSGYNLDVKSGSYTVSAPWVLNKGGVTVNFESGSLLTATNGLDKPVLEESGANNMIINNVVINGNAAHQKSAINWNGANGISIGGSNNVINNAQIYDVYVWGIVVWGTSNNEVENSKIYNCGSNGITIGDIGSSAINNNIYAVSDVGISLYGTSATVKNNYIHDLGGTSTSGGGSAEYGIAVEGNGNTHGASANTITNNTLNNCGVGIVINTGQSTDAGGNTIVGNTITNCHYPYGGSALAIGYGVTPNNIYDNNFGSGNVAPAIVVQNNSIPNVWSSGGQGNYYSDYLTRYPSATQIGTTGIENAHYYICLNPTKLSTEYDPYPLWAP
jgi:hypothetical protein